MREFFKSAAGLVVLVVLGLIVAGAGTATAARLITSADIKNGTIKGKDIKAGTIGEKNLSADVKAKLNSGGPQGPKGDPGTPAPGGFVIKDGDGKAVDGFVTVGETTFIREVDDMLWEYRWDGQFSNDIVFFTGPNCTGTALVGAPPLLSNTPPPNPQTAVRSSNGQGYRVTSAPPQDRAIQSRIFNFGGQCDVFPVAASFTLALEPVNTPPTLKGPLTVQANP